MRFVVLTALLLAAPAVHADELAPGKKPAKKSIQLDKIEVGGVRQAPVQVVVPRDPTVKITIDKSREQALKEAAERIK